MMLWKRLWLLLPAVLLAVTLGTVSAFAQDEEAVSFENVRLWLYPEYDDPRLLVMLEGQVVGVDVPATVNFLVPATAEMYSAGSRDADGVYSDGNHVRESSEVPGWDEISYTLTTPTFRVEYYDDIILGSPDRSIDYQFRTRYPIADLKVYAQEPMGSRDYAVTGLGESSLVGPGESAIGFTDHGLAYQDLGVADVLDFQIAYARSTDEPSLGSAAAASSEVEGGGSSTGVAVAVTAAVLIVLGGGAVWVYRARGVPARAPVSQSPPVNRERPVKHRPETARSVKGKARAGRFCTSCGERLSSADRFCSGCGARRD